MSKKILFSVLVLSLMSFSLFKGEKKETKVLLSTEYGNIKIKLFNETPQHRDNFIKLVKEGFYNETLFHRVIKDFMIQGGDPDSKNAQKGESLGEGDVGYTIPAEFNTNLIHKKGALAAARQPDNVNPQKRSSGCQFYIVQGRKFTTEEIEKIEKSKEGRIKYTDEQYKAYQTIGGYPPLDMDYTVFGEVIEGLDVVDKIAALKRDKKNRPIEDVKMTIKIIK
ncbi:MAG: peptidylprolyl isomerase [Vicingaceae bacterium]|jgi:peptidyl-prolyl cis-trans isomerase B (cyclophilin B)|nr:peptidylprolyl isomerase [Flavobacteriales bacterium]MBQ20360.1 peptidylprolyl isomerase [Flavobacteriales bacterium]MDF1674550.1 peptidylprolyl isomerase [Vicingaceae bacterium]|tara:strand:+ start:123051 stop:123719 length:669 start_codon:yes stop_codon:yes gene_type:complete